MNTKALALLILTSIASGCGGSGSSSGGTQVISANITGATMVGRFRAASTSSANEMFARSPFSPSRIFDQTVAGLNADSKGSVLEDQDMVVVNESTGALTKVFSEVSIPIYNTVNLPNHLIVNGPFTNLVDTSGNPFSCYLMAISKADNSIYCIDANPVGIYINSMASSSTTWSGYSQLGWAVKPNTNTIYYIDNSIVNGGGSGTSTLYSWTEGATSSQVVYQDTPTQAGCTGMVSVFTDSSATGNVCVVNPSLGCASGVAFNGNIICGNSTNGFNALSLSQSPDSSTMQLGNIVMTEQQTINLSTLAISTRTQISGEYLPDSALFNIAPSADGGVVAVSYESGEYLMHYAPDGTSNALDVGGFDVADPTQSKFYQNLFNLSANSAWTYASTIYQGCISCSTLGGTTLRRINLQSETMDNVNYLSQTGMASITSMSLSPSGEILLTGESSSGGAVFASIDVNDHISVSGARGQALDLAIPVN